MTTKSIRINRDLARTIATRVIDSLPPIDETKIRPAAFAFRNALEPVLTNICMDAGLKVAPLDDGPAELRPHIRLLQKLGMVNPSCVSFGYRLLGVQINGTARLSSEAQDMLCLPFGPVLALVEADREDNTARDRLRAACRDLAKEIDEINAQHDRREDLRTSIEMQISGRTTAAISKEMPELARFMPVATTGGALVLVGPCDLVQQLVAAGLKVAP